MKKMEPAIFSSRGAEEMGPPGVMRPTWARGDSPRQMYSRTHALAKTASQRGEMGAQFKVKRPMLLRIASINCSLFSN